MPGPKTNEREGTRAVLRYVRVSPYKLRQVIDVIRGKPVEEAADVLRFVERDAALIVDKLLHSAVANAANNDHLDPEELYVSACFVDEGPTAKRWRPRARGRATRIRKRSSHVTVIVSRLPEERLARLQARRRAENLAMRQRRVEATRRSRTGEVEGAQNRRERRHPETIPAAEEEQTTEEALETGETTSAEQALLNEVTEEEAPEAGDEATTEAEGTSAPASGAAAGADVAESAEETEPEPATEPAPEARSVAEVEGSAAGDGADEPTTAAEPTGEQEEEKDS